jgi:paraquat-inducible protein B
MGRLENVPFEQIGEEIAKTLQDAQNFLSAEEIETALIELKNSLEQINEFAENLNSQIVPNLSNVLDSAKEGIDKISSTLNNAEMMMDSDSPVSVELQRALQELSSAARSIRITAEYLERHPDALLYGKGRHK